MSFEKITTFFKDLGYNVYHWPNSKNSGIAYNSQLCIPFTIRHDGLLCAVSFLAADMEAIKKYYAGDQEIGYAVYNDFINDYHKFTHFGKVANHDHSLFEIESALT